MKNSHTNISFFGPGYVTKAVHLLKDGVQKIATSRRHRKGRGTLLVTPAGVKSPPPRFKYPWLHFWEPTRLTWWVAVLFIIGSALFSVGGYALTFPEDAPKALSTGMTLDWIFFIGSLFFTSAAFCQFLESMNAGDSEGLYAEEKLPDTFQWMAWHPQRIGYMASLVQLIGTVMFNFNTGNAFISDLNWIQQDVLIWTPNIIGCICFLIASRLAFMEVCHGYWGWQPDNIEWWITVLNLLGSIGFMNSALYSLAVPPGESSATFSWLAAFFTFQGGVCFFIASYLLLPEMFSD
ncbi:MAG: hypothetical protein K9L22_10290 [Methylococcaceae bacterium]|nr:hypothetical protein [Methylococcaceae bacterium]